MNYSSHQKEQRKDLRINSQLAATINIGSQLSVQGFLKDISQKSAFIQIKNNIFLKPSDEIGFTIMCSKDINDVVKGLARVSRIVPGEGLVIYFTKINELSSKCLSKLLQKSLYKQ